MIKGAIDFLLSDSREAKMLRKKFVFRIVPMLNPDGVIYGNYRCSLLGVDLNRRWKNPNVHLHPTVYYTKKLIQMFSEDHEILMYCDMHGHSMKKNVFMYACDYKSSDFGLEDRKTNIFIRLIPFLLSKRNRLFSYESSHFRLEKFKETTARIVNFKEFNILASYTLEASFFGPEVKDNDDIDSHMNTDQLESLGRDLCKQLTIFLSPKEFRSKFHELYNYLNSPTPSVAKRRAISARRKETSREDSSPVLGTDEFDIQEAIKEIPEEQLQGLCLNEEKSDSGGSDIEASDNDEKKISYLLSKNKKKIKKRHEKNRFSHICQNKITSQVKPRNLSLTPDLNFNTRSKSRISVIKSSYNNNPAKSNQKRTLLKSSFVDETSDKIHNSSSFDIKQGPEKPRKFRESVPIRTSRGMNGFIISSPYLENSESTVYKSIHKLTEKHFNSIYLKK